ncbi:MAG: ATP:cob(I)alamin adenosyltransferase [Chloroflexi bacterium]|nr:ATP:cob(I)alamin adenosyltransferase [Chloroflexota bacterium]|tara:strand:+ start:1706 stop:2266 length:561 start_codon:yes stop_codon:yes gene_type:complete
MGKRLSKIYTRTGDKGETGLGDGTRVSKTHPRIEAIGALDELNSVLGLLTELIHQAGNEGLDPIETFLRGCQHRVFDLGGELSIPGLETITQAHVEAIEAALDSLNGNLEPLEDFVLPSGSVLIAQCHVARSNCRRAERKTVSLSEVAKVNEPALEFLNRLSDYLFVAARSCARLTGVDEVLWKKG